MKIKNPTMANQIQNMMVNNNNPMELLKQITNDYSPEQMKSLFENARQFGVSNDVLSQIQNGINTK